MTRAEVEREFEQLLVDQFSVPREAITADAHLLKDLGLDSLDLLSAMTAMEDQLGVRIPNDDVPKMQTVSTCIDKITERLANPLPADD